MARDFDASRRSRRRSEEDRSFVLHGEQFMLLSAVHPSALEPYDSITSETPVKETMDAVDEVITAMLDPRENAHERYRLIREDKIDPVTIEDLQELVEWMVEVQAGNRPTGQPGGSSSGPQTTTPISTPVSSGPVLGASTT